MKSLISVAILLTTSMFAPSSFAEDGHLRKCSFYEIMNDKDEDGLVQGSSGQSVCYYLHKDTGAQAAQINNGPVTSPTDNTTTPRTTIKVEQKPAASNSRKKGYDHYSEQDDTADAKRSTVQKARHDSMRASPLDNKSAVEVRGWDPEAKDVARKVQMPALDGSSKESLNEN